MMIAILTGVIRNLSVASICITRSPLVWSFPCSYDGNLFFNFLAHVPFLGPPGRSGLARGARKAPCCLLLGRVLPCFLTFPPLPARCTERQRCCWDEPSAGHTASSLRQTFGVLWSVHTVPSGCTWKRHTVVSDWSRKRQTSSDAVGGYLNLKCWFCFLLQGWTSCIMLSFGKSQSSQKLPKKPWVNLNSPHSLQSHMKSRTV